MNKLKPVILLVAIIWVVFLVDLTFGLNLSVYGILPRNVTGMRGIVFAPFLHGNIHHIVSNTVPLAVLASVLFLFYTEKAWHVVVGSILISGMLVWVFGRPALHIGISGLIFALAAFLVFAGFYKKKFWTIVISIGVIALYGGTLLWGVLPINPYVSIEGHLAGAVSGIILARVFYRGSKA